LVVPHQPHLFDTTTMRWMEEFVTFFSLMTYDKSAGSSSGGFNSPLPWFKETIETLTNSWKKLDYRVLAGLNFYGYDYSLSEGGLSGVKVIPAEDAIKIMKKYKPKFQWDSAAAEHVGRYTATNKKTKTKTDHTLYIPTAEFIRKRVEALKELRQSVSIWELGQGHPSLFGELS